MNNPTQVAARLLVIGFGWLFIARRQCGKNQSAFKKFRADCRGRRPRLQRAIGVNRPYLCKLGILEFAVDDGNDLQEY